MSSIVTSEQFLLRRTAAEQQRAAQSIRGLVEAVGVFVETVDRACASAKTELEQALKRTDDLKRLGVEEHQRTCAALEHGGLEVLIAERDRLLAERQMRLQGAPPPGA